MARARGKAKAIDLKAAQLKLALTIGSALLLAGLLILIRP